MTKREALVELSGQIINGMLSSDSSLLTKIADRSLHAGAARTAVDLAIKMFERIDKHCDGKINENE